MLTLWAALVGAAGAARAGDAAGVPATAEKAAEVRTNREIVTLRGVVLGAEGKPAESAEVAAYWYGGSGRTATGADGRFRLRLPRQRARGAAVRAQTRGGLWQASHRLPYDFEAIDAPGEIRFELKPARRVEFRVVDVADQPVPGAAVGVIADLGHLPATGRTDADGTAAVLVPADVRVRNVYAFQGGRGLDYRGLIERPAPARPDGRPARQADGPLTLTLDGTRPLRVRVVDALGEPVPDVRLYPELLRKPGEPRALSASDAAEVFTVTTGPDGWATFDWLPWWNERSITIQPTAEGYLCPSGSYDPRTGDGTLTIAVERLEPIRGRVLHADGTPAVGIRVFAVGASYEVNKFRTAATTDRDGRYTVRAAPNRVYLLVVEDSKWAAVARTGFAVHPGRPVEGMDFTLRPATRLHGRITVGSERKPIAGQWVSVYQYGEYAHRIPGLELPNPEGRRRLVHPIIVRNTAADADGRFELFVGPGRYDIRGPRQLPVETFEITDEAERRFDFHAPRPQTGTLRGLVVTGDPPRPVAGAAVGGIYRNDRAGRDMEATAGKEGRFEVERELYRTVVHGRSPNGQLAGVVEIGPDDETVTVPLRPVAAATGRLVDAVSGQPLPGREVVYGVWVPIGDDHAPSRTSFGGTVKTGEDGRFELPRLMVGQKYEISVTIEEGRWRGVGEVRPEKPEHLQLGDLELKPDYKPPTLDERIAAAFQAKQPPRERLDAALADGRLSRQHVLIVFGDPEAEATRALFQLRYEDQTTRRALDPFRIVPVAVSEENAAELAKRFGETLTAGRLPLLCVVGPEGEWLDLADAAALSTGGQDEGAIDGERLLRFLRQNAPEPLDAREVLKDALARAKAEGKRVIVQETATWCGPCWSLSRFLDRHRAKWEPDYVWVKMDHRWDHCRDVMKPLRNGAEGGIPWWAVLDADGKVLVTSNDKHGENIGFPSDERGIAHFEHMLSTTATRMTPADIDALAKALKDRKP